jgi:hypothetical protein
MPRRQPGSQALAGTGSGPPRRPARPRRPGTALHRPGGLQHRSAVAGSPRTVACRVSARYTEGPPQVDRRPIPVPYERPAHLCGTDTQTAVLSVPAGDLLAGYRRAMHIKSIRPGRAPTAAFAAQPRSRTAVMTGQARPPGTSTRYRQQAPFPARAVRCLLHVCSDVPKQPGSNRHDPTAVSRIAACQPAFPGTARHPGTRAGTGQGPGTADS